MRSLHRCWKIRASKRPKSVASDALHAAVPQDHHSHAHTMRHRCSHGCRYEKFDGARPRRRVIHERRRGIHDHVLWSPVASPFSFSNLGAGTDVFLARPRSCAFGRLLQAPFLSAFLGPDLVCSWHGHNARHTAVGRKAARSRYKRFIQSNLPGLPCLPCLPDAGLLCGYAYHYSQQRAQGDQGPQHFTAWQPGGVGSRLQRDRQR